MPLTIRCACLVISVQTPQRMYWMSSLTAGGRESPFPGPKSICACAAVARRAQASNLRRGRWGREDRRACGGQSSDVLSPRRAGPQRATRTRSRARAMLALLAHRHPPAQYAPRHAVCPVSKPRCDLAGSRRVRDPRVLKASVRTEMWLWGVRSRGVARGPACPVQEQTAAEAVPARNTGPGPPPTQGGVGWRPPGALQVQRCKVLLAVTRDDSHVQAAALLGRQVSGCGCTAASPKAGWRGQGCQVTASDPQGHMGVPEHATHALLLGAGLLQGAGTRRGGCVAGGCVAARMRKGPAPQPRHTGSTHGRSKSNCKASKRQNDPWRLRLCPARNRFGFSTPQITQARSPQPAAGSLRDPTCWPTAAAEGRARQRAAAAWGVGAGAPAACWHASMQTSRMPALPGHLHAGAGVAAPHRWAPSRVNAADHSDAPAAARPPARRATPCWPAVAVQAAPARIARQRNQRAHTRARRIVRHAPAPPRPGSAGARPRARCRRPGRPRVRAHRLHARGVQHAAADGGVRGAGGAAQSQARQEAAARRRSLGWARASLCTLCMDRGRLQPPPAMARTSAEPWPRWPGRLAAAGAARQACPPGERDQCATSPCGGAPPPAPCPAAMGHAGPS